VQKKDINTDENIFASLEFDFFQFSSSLLLEYGRKRFIVFVQNL